MDRGFLFGDGVYEVTAIIECRLVDNTIHLKRLARSLAEIGISDPFTIKKWTEIETKLMQRNELHNGLIYIQVSRGVAERTFQYADDLEPTVVMFPQFAQIQSNPLTRTGARIITVPDLRWARRDINSTSLLARVMAKPAQLGKPLFHINETRPLHLPCPNQRRKMEPPRTDQSQGVFRPLHLTRKEGSRKRCLIH